MRHDADGRLGGPAEVAAGDRLPEQEEAEYFEESRDAYLKQTKFTENTDLKDLDRLLVLELMTFRWTQHLAAGADYDGDMVNERQLTADIKLYCVDEDTEILTERGWARYDQVVPGERVYTLNTDTGQGGWQVPEALHSGKGHKMLRLVSRQHDSTTARQHDDTRPQPAGLAGQRQAPHGGVAYLGRVE